MNISENSEFVTLQPDQLFFETVYTAAPLVVVGTREADGTENLAPKHMAIPLGWGDYFGFVCTPDHGTYRNAERTGVFTVSYARPENALEASLAAAPRDEEDSKPALADVETADADAVDAPVLDDAYAVLECTLQRTVDGFGAVGDGAHKTYEYVTLDALADRVTLLAACLCDEPLPPEPKQGDYP